MVVHIGNNVLNFNKIIIKLIVNICTVLSINNNIVYSNNYDYEFNRKLTDYIKLAKRISIKSEINELDVKNLLKSALLVLEHNKI